MVEDWTMDRPLWVRPLAELCGSRKYPSPPPLPPTEGICPVNPPPLRKFQFSFIHCFKFLALRDLPSSLEFPIPSGGGGGEYGYFLEPHIIRLETGQTIYVFCSWFTCVHYLCIIQNLTCIQSILLHLHGTHRFQHCPLLD